MFESTIDKFADTGAKMASDVKSRTLAYFVGAMMAGAYIGFGDILMFTVGAHAGPAWGHLIMGCVFAVGLTLVVFAGANLFTGVAMYMSLAVLRKKATLFDLLQVWLVCWVGNFVGAFVLAAILKLAGGGVLLTDGADMFFSVVNAKVAAAATPLLFKAILCNWLVCLGIWMAARTTSDAAKLGLVFWPVMLFVACGYEHCVANMFAFSLALLANHPDGVSIAGVAYNLSWVTLGNIIGGAVMMGVGYWAQTSNSTSAPLSSAAPKRV